MYSVLNYSSTYIGGGTPESRRAIELSELLGVNVLPSQVVICVECLIDLLISCVLLYLSFFNTFDAGRTGSLKF